MQDLIKTVMEKAGISADQSKISVETVLAFLKDKLPPGLSGQLDSLLAGNAGSTDAASVLDAVKGKLGGFLGS